jgi:hypothetical protein
VTTSVEEIVNLWREREKVQHPWIARMRTIRDVYNGDIVVPLPELEENEQAAVANLIQLGIEQTAKRIASALPRLSCPPERPGIKKSEEAAALRRKVLSGWWETNRIRTKQRRRARWFVAYTCAPVVIRPNFQTKQPEWVVRDPLSTFPAGSNDPDEIAPVDCIFTFQRGYGWLKARYPEEAAAIHRAKGCKASDVFDLIEYVDADETVLALLGKAKPANSVYTIDDTQLGVAPYLELERIPNRAGVCTAVVPGRITLDHPLGMFDGLKGMYDMQAKLMALQVIAAQKNVFPDQWVVSNGIGNPEIIVEADGLLGQIGQIKDGTIVPVHTDPAQSSLQVMDRLESNMRQEGGIPAEFGGLSSTNIRTGRRGDSIMSATVDPTIQEAQECFEYALAAENERAIAISKGYWGKEALSVYFGRGAAAARADYVPEEVFTTDQNVVSYAYAGADQSGLIIEIGQRLGMGTMSKKTAMQLDPILDDGMMEHSLVIGENLEGALLASLDQQAQGGMIPPMDIARIVELVQVGGKTLFEAVQQAQREAQERQASAGPVGTPEGPVPAGSPEAQPGLGPAGQGAEAPVAPPTEGSTNLMDQLRTLRSISRTSGPTRPESGA